MIHIHVYEKWWMGITAAMLIVLALLVGVASFVNGFQVPQPYQRVDPRTVKNSSPWTDADLGLRELAPGKYEAHILAQSSPWRFYPDKLEIPVGSTVTFYITSVDVQHGFKIQDTNINMMILPGQVSKLTKTFDKAGTFPYVCTEYCGTGHHTMYGTITVK